MEEDTIRADDQLETRHGELGVQTLLLVLAAGMDERMAKIEQAKTLSQRLSYNTSSTNLKKSIAPGFVECTGCWKWQEQSIFPLLILAKRSKQRVTERNARLAQL